MITIQQMAAQAAREARSIALPCGGYQYIDKPPIDPDLRAAEAAFYRRIIAEYGSIDAYNQREGR